MNTKTKKLILTALFAALTCIATMIIKIPSPLKGYINLGDCIVLVSSWILSPIYGFISAALGSALADVFSGYMTYAPATFVIKGFMVLISFYTFKIMSNKTSNLFSKIISGILAEIVMIGGYFVYEGFLYGFVPSLVNIPANTIQGGVSLIIGIVLMKVIEKNKNCIIIRI